MVSRTRRHAATILSLFVLVFVASAAQAGVSARVDRNTIDLNESFLLEVVVDTDISVEPDISAVRADFDVLQSSQLSNTMIVNNEITRSRTFTYQLMAKQTGRIEIPAIIVGNDSSQPIPITVREPTQSPPGEADVFITAEVDYDETYVQAQVLYRIKVYRAVPTRQPALRDPVFSGTQDPLVEIAGDERSYDSVLNGRTYNVVERVYAVFPQQSGEVTISPARFEARVLRDGRITGRKVFESEAHTINVLPIPELPADFPNAAWLPARDLQLSEDWSREPEELSAGEPITRSVIISVLGQLETQIPALEPPVVEGVNVYPDDRPDLSKRIEPGGIRGIREEQYAMIAVAAGTIELPELEIPWWDVNAREWKVASLPARSISVAGSGEPAVIETTPVETEIVEELAAAENPGSAETEFWQRAAEVLAVLWLLTLVAWWWQTRPQRRREPTEPSPPPVHKQQARLLKDARKAAQEGDGAGRVRNALLEWGRLEWPDASPRSIGALAERVSSPLSDELAKLSSAAYSSNGASWDGDAVAQYLRSFAVLDEHAPTKSDDPLPPLMPQS